MTYNLVAGDSGTTLRVVIQSAETEEALDLTGRTVVLRWSQSGAPSQTRTMTVLNQTTARGKAEYTFQEADIANGGELKCEVVMHTSGENQVTSLSLVTLYARDPLT